MACPFFREDRGARCRAISEDVVPSMHERERFCCSRDYGDCPTLRMMLRLRRPITESEYLAIYLPPAPGARSPEDASPDVEHEVHDPRWRAVIPDGRRER
jgi:hypothetical protein